MAVETVYPTAVSSPDEWDWEDPLAISADKVDAVTDTIASTGISVTDAVSNGRIQLFTFAPMVATTAVVSSVHLVVSMQVTDAVPGYTANYKAYWDLDGITKENDSAYVATEITATETILMLHPGGGSWTVDAVNRLKAGLKAHDIDLCKLNCWELELLVTYTAGGLPIRVKLGAQMEGMTSGPLT